MPALTFAKLDQQDGTPPMPKTPAEELSFTEWYRTVYATPLDQLSTEDMARACRENVHLNHIVPLALELFEENITTGNIYDGELLISLINIPVSFWIKHDSHTQLLKLMIQNNKDALPKELLLSAREFIKKVSP